jgi:hypothetical protein
MTNRKKLALRNDSTMFDRDCKPFNLECKLSDSIIVWENDKLILGEIELVSKQLDLGVKKTLSLFLYFRGLG